MIPWLRRLPTLRADACTVSKRLRHVDQPSQRAGPIVTETNDQKPRCGGWHRADEAAPPPCPSTTTTTDTHQPSQPY